ncbi:MAG: MAPEG family protein [Gammaproteobacteria bacterium]|nr:MAPEG family protein [Gammaproteobacteria bacterium]
MVALTAVVWTRMYAVRLSEIRTRRIDPQSLATRGSASRLLENTAAAENFGNLFEVPVLFSAVCLALALTGAATAIQLLLAWTFVSLRVAHSFIHLGSNRVIYRFAAHVLATVTVFFMWILFAIQLVKAR